MRDTNDLIAAAPLKTGAGFKIAGAPCGYKMTFFLKARAPESRQPLLKLVHKELL
jgi:hypothetical protein